MSIRAFDRRTCPNCGPESCFLYGTCTHCKAQPPTVRYEDRPRFHNSTRAKRTHYRLHSKGRARSVDLTASEKQIVTLLGQGLTDHEIAERTGKGRYTVTSTISRARDRLCLRTRVDLAAWGRAQQQGSAA